MPDWLAQRARLSPRKAGLIDRNGRAYTWEELDRSASAFAALLSRHGIECGDRVAVFAGNGYPYALAVMGIARLGATLVPINVRLADAEIAFQLRTVGAAALLADVERYDRAAGLFQSPLMLDELAARASEGRVGEPGPGRRPSLPGFGTDLDRPQGILFTSGTTGSPKGAVLTFGNHWWSAVGSALNLGLREDDRWLLCLPLFHVGGLSIVMRSVVYGIPAVVHERFDPEEANRAIDQEGVTIVSVVSQMLERMLDARRDAPFPRTLRCLLAGGGPVPKPLLERCVRINAPVVQTYGMTETASQAATLAPADALAKLGSAGKPLFCTELEIDAPAGEVGEIRVRGPNVSPGYVTARGFERREEAWHLTGDLGYFDDEGYLYVVSRRTDLIISGGENVYPAEVEAVLESHPDVLEAGVVGRDDERWGQAPVAFVVIKPGRRFDAAELAAYCRARLAKFKVPVAFHELPALPRNASGKLLRRALADAAPSTGKEQTTP